MQYDLPSPLLRSFIAVVDSGTLANAARRIGRSESAVSLQMSRLEAIVGEPLFSRTGRALELNNSGLRLLPHARAILRVIDAAKEDMKHLSVPQIRIGIVQDFVGSVLQPTLADLRASNPSGEVSIFIGSTSQIIQALGENRIDTALCAGSPIGARPIAQFQMEWFGVPEIADRLVLPLISIAQSCPYSNAAQRALDEMGRPWRIEMATPSLDGVRAASAAGLGVSCRTVAGIGLVPLRLSSLPALPKIDYSILERRNSGKSVSETAAFLEAHLLALC